MTGPDLLAEFAPGRLRAHLEYSEEAIEALRGRIGELLAPFAGEVALPDTLHGVNRRTAEAMVAESGADITVFPSEHHLASWAALRPGNHERATRRARQVLEWQG